MHIAFTPGSNARSGWLPARLVRFPTAAHTNSTLVARGYGLLTGFSPNQRLCCTFDQDEIIREAYRLGASGFVTKSSSPSVIAEAVHQVAEGKVHFLPEIAERLALLGVRGDDSPLKNLDERSREVFRLMALGHTNVEIAEQMGLSPKTISTTSQSIKDELGISRPAEITRLALRLGLIEA